MKLQLEGSIKELQLEGSKKESAELLAPVHQGNQRQKNDSFHLFFLFHGADLCYSH